MVFSHENNLSVINLFTGARHGSLRQVYGSQRFLRLSRRGNCNGSARTGNGLHIARIRYVRRRTPRRSEATLYRVKAYGKMEMTLPPLRMPVGLPPLLTPQIRPGTATVRFYNRGVEHRTGKIIRNDQTSITIEDSRGVRYTAFVKDILNRG